MTRHIGLIGGIGPAATEFYYRGLIEAAEARDGTLELTIAHANLSAMMVNMAEDGRERQAEQFVHLARRLAAAGAETLVVSSMSGHFCIRELEARSPLPVLNAIPELAAELGRRGLRRVGLLGTRTVMGSRMYGGLEDFDVVLPPQDAVHDDYIALAVAGVATEPQRERLFAAGRELCREHGAEAVILGGTDLFLAFRGRDPGFPVIDSARVHVDAIARACL